MKPKELKYPYLDGERRIYIEDRVWYVPDFFVDYSTFNFPGFSAKELFGNENPIFVEYCSGNGAWIAEKAKAHPEQNWIAVEKNFKRVRKIWSKIKNYNLDNLIVICGEAYITTNSYFPKGSIEGVFINFPDPWPKKKHAKNRLMSPEFIEVLGEVMREDATFCLVTDDPDYSELGIDVLLQSPVFSPVMQEPYFVTELVGYGNSYFETLWRDKGRTIRYHKFKRKTYDRALALGR